MARIQVRRRGRRIAVAGLISLVAAALVPASAQAQLAECPTVMPSSEVAKGMMGTGYTVSEGTEPEPFSVEVLGVLENGIGPGRDMIIVDTSSPAIERAGGIWYGMSGSPVYVNGELIGAIAYGLSWGPSSIGGITPADQMLAIAERPTTARVAAGNDRARLSDELRARIARSTGSGTDEVGRSMKRLLTPLSVSGVGDRVMKEVARTIGREDLPLVPYMGSSASAVPAPSDEPVQPGGNFAAAISYGDVTFAGVGTATYVCDGKVLAFGHPFSFYPEGATTLGGNHADAITIVPDSLGGSFKLANITGSVGMVDQDRFAGIRALLGEQVTTIPITSQITAGPSTRSGSSDALTSEFTPFVALIHTLSNVDFTRDEIDEGSADLAWTITGTTSSGAAWSLERSNVFSSEYDVNYESLIELEQHLYTLINNNFDEIEFTGIDVTGDYEDAIDRLKLTDVLVSADGENYSGKGRVKIERGGTVYVRALLEPYETGDDVTLDFEIDVPRRVRYGASISVGSSGGGYSDDYYCLVYGEDCGSDPDQPESFEELIAQLETAPTNDQFLATLFGGRGNTLHEEVRQLDAVVQGQDYISVIVKGAEGGGSSGSGGGGSEPKPPQDG